jgi:hypothetical protein
MKHVEMTIQDNFGVCDIKDFFPSADAEVHRHELSIIFTDLLQFINTETRNIVDA